MTTGMKDSNRHAAVAKLKDNVLRESSGETPLVCGHTTKGQPIATFADGRKMFECPKGCGLVHMKRRSR